MTTPNPQVHEPTAPDFDARAPAQQRQRSWRTQGPIVAVVALGGAVGASARYGASQLWPVMAAVWLAATVTRRLVAWRQR
ncbi:hypothetical protein [Streptomyces sp. NPDC007205]|uniref:hypothetical protein n=1 Tax=Streptomyces sp. NPDC007205 TaxID=3154316 RepID=UPI0033F869AA